MPMSAPATRRGRTLPALLRSCRTSSHWMVASISARCPLGRCAQAVAGRRPVPLRELNRVVGVLRSDGGIVRNDRLGGYSSNTPGLPDSS